MTEALKQKQYAPYSVAEQVIILLAATGGAFDHLVDDAVAEAIHALLVKMKKDHGPIITAFNKGDKPAEDGIKTVMSVAEHIAKSYGKE